MRMLKHRVVAVACAAALSMIFTRTGAAQMAREPEIQRETQAVYRSRIALPPPEARTEAKPAPAGAVWVPGFWNLEGDRMTAPRGGWVWVPGRLENPPMPGASWDDAHWGWNAGWYTWIPGHWDEPGRGK